MNTINKTSRILGCAFLFQLVTSISSGMFLKSAWFVAGDMSKTMLKIANNPLLFRAGMMLDMLTALGVTFLGVILFLTLRKENEKIALTAMAFYILEGALMAVSRLETLSLLHLSQEYVAAGKHPI